MSSPSFSRKYGMEDTPACLCVKIPRVFLKGALTQMVDYAREQGWTLIDVPQMQEIRDKRAREKKK
jgi:hypothetical protein